VIAMTISLADQVESSAYREYIHYLRGRLVKAEAGLAAMNDKYDRAKTHFDQMQARRGITPETDVVNYIELKSMSPQLKYWYSKVEHYQREVAAYGTALTGLEAAHRMLGTDDNWMDNQDRSSPAD
jgi:hypothetical protein